MAYLFSIIYRHILHTLNFISIVLQYLYGFVWNNKCVYYIRAILLSVAQGKYHFMGWCVLCARFFPMESYIHTEYRSAPFNHLTASNG